MSMRTIYIRKENEETFDNLENKSKVFNAVLAQLREREEKKKEVEYQETDFT